MDDGIKEFSPEDMGVILPVHNAWMVGNNPIVAIDFTDLRDYAKARSSLIQTKTPTISS